MKKYIDRDKLQEFATKLTNKYKTLFSSPLVASTAADMTDTEKVYVYVGSESGYTNGNWYYYDGSAWTSGGVYNAVAVDLDNTLTVAGKAADAKSVGDAIDNLKDNIDEYYLPIDGENLVMPQNISGVTFAKTVEDIEGNNIFEESMLFEEGYYVSINTSTQKIAHNGSASYNAYCIPVEQNSKYTFTTARFACLGKGNVIGSEAVGTLQAYAAEIETGEATYLFLSISASIDVSDIEVHKVTEDYVYSDFKMPEWSGIPDLQDRVYNLSLIHI